MLPFPKIFNNNILPQDELQLLKDEVLNGTYFEIKYNPAGYKDTPQAIPNVNTYMNGMGGAGSIGTMWGSSYGTRFTQDSSYRRAYQHAFPTDAIFQYYNTNPDTPAIMIRSEIGPGSSFISITRNGYSSNAYGATNYPSVTADLFVYYDHSLDKVMKYSPFLKDTPTPYY